MVTNVPPVAVRHDIYGLLILELIGIKVHQKFEVAPIFAVVEAVSSWLSPLSTLSEDGFHVGAEVLHRTLHDQLRIILDSLLIGVGRNLGLLGPHRLHWKKLSRGTKVIKSVIGAEPSPKSPPSGVFVVNVPPASNSSGTRVGRDETTSTSERDSISLQRVRHQASV